MEVKQLGSSGSSVRVQSSSTGSTARNKIGPIFTIIDQQQFCKVSKAHFELLQPVTIQIMSNPTVLNLTQLINVIDRLPDTIDDCILDYVIFPLTHHLKMSGKLKDDVLITLHDCVKTLLKKWEIPKFTYFAELYQFCIISICKYDDPGSFDKSLSEAFVGRVVLTIHTLIRKSLSKHFKKLYSEKYIAAVGHGICILLQIVNHDTIRSLRIQAIRTITYLIRICEGDDDACHRVFKFLPGLATTFVRCCIIHGGRFQSDIIKESLDALKVTLITCISCEHADSLIAVDTNLSTGLVEISDSLLLHDEKRLTDALAGLTMSVLQNSKMKLPKCEETLWNNVLIFAGSCNDDESSMKCLELLKNPGDNTLPATLCNFKSIEQHLKKAVILSNIGELSKCSLTARAIVGALSITKLMLPEFRCILPRIIDLRTTVVRRQHEYKDKPLQVHDKHIVNLCSRMCQVIVTVNSYDVETVVSEFFTLLDHEYTLEDVTSFSSSGTVLLMNELFHSFLASRPVDLSYHLVQIISEKYLTLLCPLPLINEVSATERLKPSSHTTPKQMECIRATSFGISVHNSSILQAFPIFTNLEPLLQPLLTFPLLQYAGLQDHNCDHVLVSSAAIDGLTKIASLSNLTLREYLSQNLDLVMSEFGSRTEIIIDYPHMTDALIFLAEYFDFSQNNFLQFIEHIIQFSTSANLDNRFHHIFSNIYQAYVNSMWKHYYEDRQPEESSELSNSSEEVEGPSFFERLFGYQKVLGISVPSSSPKVSDALKNLCPHTDGAEEDLCKNRSNSDDESNYKTEKALLPPEASLTLKIARKAASYLTEETRELKLNSMDILIKAIQILSPYEDELLPLLHQCWTTLASRFREREYIVIRKSFELLLTMVNHSGDFLRRRTIDGIFPILSSFLEELAEHSNNIDDRNTSYYTFTQGYKLQHTILTGLPELCEVMQIGERDLDGVVKTCVIYLAPSQHTKLKKAAMDLMFNLADGRLGASIWINLIAYGLIPIPDRTTNGEFRTFPPDFRKRLNDELKTRKSSRSRFPK